IKGTEVTGDAASSGRRSRARRSEQSLENARSLRALTACLLASALNAKGESGSNPICGNSVENQIRSRPYFEVSVPVEIVLGGWEKGERLARNQEAVGAGRCAEAGARASSRRKRNKGKASETPTGRPASRATSVQET